MAWREFLGFTMFALLFGAAIVANVTDGPLPQLRGAWATHAIR
jgi:hypothetical protein